MKKAISGKELKRYFGELDCKQFGVFSLKKIFSGVIHPFTYEKISIKNADLEKVLETTKNFQAFLRELSDILEKHGVSKETRLSLNRYIKSGCYEIGSVSLEYRDVRSNRFEVDTDIPFRGRKDFRCVTFRFGGPACSDYYKD